MHTQENIHSKFQVDRTKIERVIVSQTGPQIRRRIRRRVASREKISHRLFLELFVIRTEVVRYHEQNECG